MTIPKQMLNPISAKLILKITTQNIETACYLLKEIQNEPVHIIYRNDTATSKKINQFLI